MELQSHSSALQSRSVKREVKHSSVKIPIIRVIRQTTLVTISTQLSALAASIVLFIFG